MRSALILAAVFFAGCAGDAFGVYDASVPPPSTGGGSAASGGGSSTGGGSASTGGGGAAATGGGTEATGGGSEDDSGTPDSGSPDAGVDAGIDAGTMRDGGVKLDVCPRDGGPCRLMPLGDSITYGVGSSTGGGYRVNLFAHALDAGRNITFVGSGNTGPATVDGVPFPTGTEGHSGYTIATGGGRSGITELTANAMTTYKPDIILLMIGTNDVDIQYALPTAPDRLNTLLDLIFSTNPEVAVVLAQITPTKDSAENLRDVTYNSAMPALVAAHADAGFRITLVDMYGAFMADPTFATDYMSDTLHPNDTGHAKMGDVWFEAVKPSLR